MNNHFVQVPLPSYSEQTYTLSPNYYTTQPGVERTGPLPIVNDTQNLSNVNFESHLLGQVNSMLTNFMSQTENVISNKLDRSLGQLSLSNPHPSKTNEGDGGSFRCDPAPYIQRDGYRYNDVKRVYPKQDNTVFRQNERPTWPKPNIEFDYGGYTYTFPANKYREPAYTAGFDKVLWKEILQAWIKLHPGGYYAATSRNRQGSQPGAQSGPQIQPGYDAKSQPQYISKVRLQNGYQTRQQNGGVWRGGYNRRQQSRGRMQSFGQQSQREVRNEMDGRYQRPAINFNFEGQKYTFRANKYNEPCRPDEIDKQLWKRVIEEWIRRYPGGQYAANRTFTQGKAKPIEPHGAIPNENLGHNRDPNTGLLHPNTAATTKKEKQRYKRAQQDAGANQASASQVNAFDVPRGPTQQANAYQASAQQGGSSISNAPGQSQIHQNFFSPAGYPTIPVTAFSATNVQGNGLPSQSIKKNPKSIQQPKVRNCLPPINGILSLHNEDYYEEERESDIIRTPYASEPNGKRFLTYQSVIREAGKDNAKVDLTVTKHYRRLPYLARIYDLQVNSYYHSPAGVNETSTDPPIIKNEDHPDLSKTKPCVVREQDAILVQFLSNNLPADLFYNTTKYTQEARTDAYKLISDLTSYSLAVVRKKLDIETHNELSPEMRQHFYKTNEDGTIVEKFDTEYTIHQKTSSNNPAT